MENMTVNENRIPAKQRDINVVTTEIKTLCSQAQSMLLLYAIEIGRRLREAKDILPHGEWGAWLSEGVNFSQSTANNYMRIFDEYGAKQISVFGAEANSQTLGNLPYTKALKLLMLPEEEREAFVKENDVEGLSTRELDRLIKERDSAVKQAREAEERAKAAEEAENKLTAAENEITEKTQEADRLSAEISKLETELAKAKEAEKRSKEKLRAIKDNPEVPQEVVDKLKKQAEDEASSAAEEKIKAGIQEAENKLKAAEAAKQAAEAAAEESKKEIEALRKKVKMSDPDVIAFRAAFDRTQRDMQELSAALEKIKSSGSDAASGLEAAFRALIGKYAQPQE